MKNSVPTGFIAISSVLVIMVIVLVIGTTVSLLSVQGIQLSLSSKKSDEALSLVEGCVADALLRLNEQNQLPASVSLPEGSCIVTLNEQAGVTWDFTVSGSFNNYTKRIQITATRQSTVEVTGWNEI